MDRTTTQRADPTCDTESQSDLRRELADDRLAQIGDAITMLAFGERIKVTMLGVVDPAVVEFPGLRAMFAKASESGDADGPAFRHVAIRLRLRNLESAGAGVIYGPCGGVLIDADGHEYASTGAIIQKCSVLWAPKRGEAPRVGCDCFRISQAAIPARYVLSISPASAGEWRVVSRAIPPAERHALS